MSTSNILSSENKNNNTSSDCRACDPDQRQDPSLFQHLPPGLHKRHIFKSRQHPKTAVPDSQPVDHNAVIHIHDLKKQQRLPICLAKGGTPFHTPMISTSAASITI